MASRSGAQTVNSMYFKPMLRKAFHRGSGSAETVISGDTAKFNGCEELKKPNPNPNPIPNNWWIPDEKTGIFYPKGQEKVMADVPSSAAKDFETIHHRFSYPHHPSIY